MFAVIKTGGKQYKVAKNDLVTVERVAAEAGSTVNLDHVLMVGAEGEAPKVGTPTVEGATVAAEVVEHVRGPKIRVFKKKRRKNYRRTHGHRQDLTVLRVADIQADGKSAAGTGEAAAARPQSRAAVKQASQAAVERSTRAKARTAKQRHAGTPSLTERKEARRSARSKSAGDSE